MQRLALSIRYLPALVTVLLGACAQAPVMRPPPADLAGIERQESSAGPDDAADQMADVRGDRALQDPGGRIEQIDCKVGTEDLHARMALEAHDGQVVSFAYYSKWRPRTCSLDMQHDDPAAKWRVTANGDTRVQTRHGSFLIRALSDAYEIEFLDVERQKFCGMDGHTNGTMTIRRGSGKPECSVTGLLDRDGYAREVADVRYSSAE